MNYKRPRIFIAIHYLEIGGAEISLIGLLQAIDYTRYDVDLFVYSHRGELMQYIPKEVNLLPEIPAYAHIERPMKEALKKGHLGIVAGRLVAKLRHKLYKRRKKPIDNAAVLHYIFTSVEPFLPRINPTVEYDMAISFLMPHTIVLNKVRAKKRVCWIHTDYTHIDVNAELELPTWSRYDHIVSISPDVTRTFLQVFPTLKDKITEIENILSPAFVRHRADEIPEEVVRQEMPREEGVINILSVGRFSYPKNYDNVPMICKIINDNVLSNANTNVNDNVNDNCLADSNNINDNEASRTHTQTGRPVSVNVNVSVKKVKWYLIGFGGDEALIRRKIAEAGMQDTVILLGKKSNPYPYIKACDIYAQPSRYEGKSVTVREAQMLCKPVIVTDYPTAKSQVHDGHDGIIVPLANNECAHAMAHAITDAPLLHHLTTYLQTHDYGNMEEIEKVYRLLR